jgi:hypothetical protein
MPSLPHVGLSTACRRYSGHLRGDLSQRSLPAFPDTGCHDYLTLQLLSSSGCIGYAVQHCRAYLVPASPGTAPLSLLELVDPRRLTTCRFTTYPVVSRGLRHRVFTHPFSWRAFGAPSGRWPVSRGRAAVPACRPARAPPQRLAACAGLCLRQPPGSACVLSLQRLWLCCGGCASQYPMLYGKTDSRDSALFLDA